MKTRIELVRRSSVNATHVIVLSRSGLNRFLNRSSQASACIRTTGLEYEEHCTIAPKFSSTATTHYNRGSPTGTSSHRDFLCTSAGPTQCSGTKCTVWKIANMQSVCKLS